MAGEKEKMLGGNLYDPGDPELVIERRRARELTQKLNASSATQWELRRQLASELFAAVGDDFSIEPPFYCDYGSNIRIGHSVFFNFNCVILDCALVEIGDNVLFGPNVQVYTASHPLGHEERRSGRELAKAIQIGSDVWIGGGAILGPGVSVGERTVIGAGSVVTKDVPEGVFAAGNPCRVIREIEP